MATIFRFPSWSAIESYRESKLKAQQLQELNKTVQEISAKVLHLDFTGPTRCLRYKMWLRGLLRYYSPTEHPLQIAEYGCLHPVTEREREICKGFWQHFYHDLIQQVACEQLLFIKLKQEVLTLKSDTLNPLEVNRRSGLNTAIGNRDSWLSLTKEAGSRLTPTHNP